MFTSGLYNIIHFFSDTKRGVDVMKNQSKIQTGLNEAIFIEVQ